MRTTDLEKLIKAGYTIIRADDYEKPCIKTFLGNFQWKSSDPFETQGKRDAAIEQMLKDPMVLLD